MPAETVANARTVASLTLVASQLYYSLAMRHPAKSIFQLGVFTNKFLIGAILIGLLLQHIVLAVPATRTAFGLEMIDTKGWALVVILGLVPLLLNEILKVIVRLKKHQQHI